MTKGERNGWYYCVVNGTLCVPNFRICRPCVAIVVNHLYLLSATSSFFFQMQLITHVNEENMFDHTNV
jgi:hypothetical protein